MKKFVCIVVCIIASCGLFGQKVSIETIGVKSYVAEYATKIIRREIPDPSFVYEFVLIQEGNQLMIRYTVEPYHITGSDETDNIGSELESLIQSICNKIDEDIHAARISQATNSSRDSSIRQKLQPVPDYSSNDRQAERPAKEQKKSEHGSFSGWINNTFGKAFSEDVVAHIHLNDYLLEDVRNGTAQIGGRIKFPDGSEGIIYHLDGEGHGLAVSLDQTKCKWQEVAKPKYCQDIYHIPNEKSIDTFCDIGLGDKYSSAVWKQIGYQATAVVWCKEHGDGWYLPSTGELWQLLVVANDNKGQAGVISLLLQAAGGTPLNGKWYWSSSEEDQENAHNISSFGAKATEGKTSNNFVRAVRAL